MGSALTAFNIKQPVLFDATVQSIRDDVRVLIDGTTATWNSILASVKTPADATFENTVMPIIQDENARSETQRVIRFYATTSPCATLRDASNTAISTLNDAEVDFLSRQDVFVLVDAVLDRSSAGREGQVLDPEATHYVSKLHWLFRLNGCSITSPSQRDVFTAKTKQLNDLVRECTRNMAADASGLWLSRDELEGVPQRVLDRLTDKGPAADGEFGISGSDNIGKLWLPTKVAFSSPVMTSATCEATRKKVYYAVVNRMLVNVPLFREVVLLRDETARMLGFRHHAALKAAGNMMQTPEAVRQLLSEISDVLRPLASEQALKLLKLKQERARAKGTVAEDEIARMQVFFWDQSYLASQASEKENPAETALSEYFELNNTLQRLLQLFEHLFGVRLVPIDTKSPNMPQHLVWHDTVLMFSAWNVDDVQSPGFLGYAYFDLITRANKWTHVGHYPLQQGYDKPDGSRFYPSSVLVMNYIQPSQQKPTLLRIDEVRKLFHELGHLFHGLLSHSQYAGLHRVNRDFVETPSMMLEQFFWQVQHIRDVSWHYSYIGPEMEAAWLSSRNPGSQKSRPAPQLDKDQAERLASTNQAKNVRDQLKELFFSTYDHLVHSPETHEELEATNLTELFNRTRADIYQIHGGEALDEGWEWGHGESVFRNILSGYDAEYYSYILGRVFALGLFDVGFKHDSTSKDAGRRYRDMVIVKGGSQPEMKTLTDYLGHRPSMGPYLAWLRSP